jgi:hypothetical protein
MGRLLEAAARRAGAVPPWLLPSLVRAFCILGPPSDEELETIVRAADARGGSRRQRWREELGGVLVALEPYREREAVREALEDLLRRDELYDWSPLARTVEAWAHHLLGLEDAEEMGRRATHLIRNDGNAAVTVQRRLGAELWERVGVPPPDLVREVLGDAADGLRRYGLRWTVLSLPEEEALAALRAGLADADEDCFLTAAETLGARITPEGVARLGEVALGAARAHRWRAFRALERLHPAGARVRAGDEPVEERRAALEDLLPRCLQALAPPGGRAPALPAGGGR